MLRQSNMVKEHLQANIKLAEGLGEPVRIRWKCLWFTFNSQLIIPVNGHQREDRAVGVSAKKPAEP